MSDGHGWRLFEENSRYVDRFGLLLLVTTLAVITLSLVDLRYVGNTTRTEIGQVLVSIFVGATLLLALRSSGVGTRLQILADVLIGVGILVTIIVILATDFTGGPSGLGTNAPLAWVTLSVIAPVVVVRRLVRHERATAATLLGAVSAFLLVALAFNFAFLTVEASTTPYFFGTEEPTTSFMYFSLTTVTTLGYGDLSAAAPLGRLLSTIEAVIGQVYLVTFVGMIVGLIVSQRAKGRD